MHVVELQCLVCDAHYAPGELETTCPACGVEGILDVHYDYERIARQLNADVLASNPDRTLWRYAPLLPVPEDAVRPRLRLGWTPIYEAPRLASALGVRTLWVKDDGQSPTGSYKDRASAIGATRALSLGKKVVACASTGNAASSLAGVAADLGLEARIFVPASAPEAKVAQLLIYGAQVFLGAVIVFSRLLGRNRRAIGIDHGFSFPLRYFEVHGLAPDWPAFLDDF